MAWTLAGWRAGGLRGIGGAVQAEVIPFRVVGGEELLEFGDGRAVAAAEGVLHRVAQHELLLGERERVAHGGARVGHGLVERLGDGGGDAERRIFLRGICGEVGLQSAEGGKAPVLRGGDAHLVVRQPGGQPCVAPRARRARC